VLEFELHWTCGDADSVLPVERFRAGYGGWCDQEVLLLLLGTEIFCTGNPDPEKYAARFPDLQGQLGTLFKVRRCLQAATRHGRARDLQSLRSVAAASEAFEQSLAPAALSREDQLEFRQTFGNFRRIGTGSFKYGLKVHGTFSNYGLEVHGTLSKDP